MVNISEILLRAASLKEETTLNSISPDRAGGIMYDTLLALNDLWLQQGSALVISKIYASVAAMEADTAPVSDLTGKPLRPGQIVVIASSDSDNGSVYRYNGTDAPSWSLVGAIGSIPPVDSLDSDSTTLPLAAHQGKVLDGKIGQLGQYIENQEQEWVKVVIDKDDKILYGVKVDGNFYFGAGCPPQVVEYVTVLLNTKVDKVPDKSLIDGEFASSQKVITDTEYLQVITDSEGKIIEATRKNGKKVFFGGIEGIDFKGVLKTITVPWEGSHTMNIISVNKDGTGDFTNIQDAINSITDASIINQYEVQVYDDFYINDLTKLYKVNSPTEHTTAAPTEQGAFIVTKDFVHLRGVGGMREIYVESPDLTMAGSCFQYVQTIFVQGNCRIENFTFKVKGGRYAVHQDMSAELNGPDSYKTTIYKDINAIHLGNQDYTNGNSGWIAQCAQANGIANGQTQIYINVSWETRSNVNATAFYAHSNANYSLPCKMVIINCRSIGKNGLRLPSWGGFSFQDLYSCQNNDIFVYNCNIPQYGGRTMGQAIQSKAPQAVGTKRYCFNRFIGHGNKPFLVNKETAKVLSFETKNVGDKIDVIGGTAFDDLWGLTYKQEDGAGIKGICYGGNYVEPGTYSQVHNLAYILGNCALNPKTLIVEITDSSNNKIQHTITFNQNYMTSDGSAYSYNTTPYISQADIIAAVNTAFSDYFTMGDTMDFVDTFEDCKEEIINKGNVTAELGTMMKKDYSLGYHCWRVANEGEIPDGVAMSRVGHTSSFGWVLLLDKNLLSRTLFGINSLLTTGALYKVGENGTIIETSEASDGVLVAVDNSTIMKL